MEAKIRKYFKDKGYGWVDAEDGRAYFFHVSSWLEAGVPVEGTAINIEIGPGKPGKAYQVTSARYDRVEVKTVQTESGVHTLTVVR
jgi:cold shock CspA family protein